jgi:hypothetical protein
MSQENKTITILSLRENKIGMAGGQKLGEALVVNRSLLDLDVGWNHIRGIGAVAVAEGLRQNGTLQHLRLTWNGCRSCRAWLVVLSLSSTDTILSCSLPLSLSLLVRPLSRGRSTSLDICLAWVSTTVVLFWCFSTWCVVVSKRCCQFFRRSQIRTRHERSSDSKFEFETS